MGQAYEHPGARRGSAATIVVRESVLTGAIRYEAVGSRLQINTVPRRVHGSCLRVECFVVGIDPGWARIPSFASRGFKGIDTSPN